MKFIIFADGEILRWMSILPLFVIGAYIAVSFLKPRYTRFGRFISRNGRVLKK